MNIKEKIEDAKIYVTNKVEDAKRFYYNNKELVIAAAPVVGMLFVEVIKTTARNRRVKEDKSLKENYIYDRSSGHYYELKHKLRSSEWLIIDERRRNGEPLGEILRNMRVLK